MLHAKQALAFCDVLVDIRFGCKIILSFWYVIIILLFHLLVFVSSKLVLD
jgi:hypothetical protein